jgi:transposase, IS5 family
LFARQGQLIDASIVPVPVQCNTREENTNTKQGEVPEEWQEQPHKLQQKDTDARWVKKNGRSHYGYKNHVNFDGKHKIIRTYTVTEASVHDSQVFDPLLDSSNTGKQVFSDSSYRSNKINSNFKKRGLKKEIHHKGYRGMPLTEAK